MAKQVSVPPKTTLSSYRYTALNQDGITVKGIIKAALEYEAENLIISRGYLPITIEEVPPMFSLEGALPSIFRVKPKDVTIFSRQLATLLRSGISILPALEVLRGQATSSGIFKKILGKITDDLHSGESFFRACSRHPTCFSDIYCKSISVGEQTGNLDNVLDRMADYYEKQGAIAKKLGGALVYPLMILGIGIVVVAVLITTVLPNLVDLFASVGTELPLPTRILMGLSSFVVNNKIAILSVMIVLAVLILWTVKQPSGRRMLDRLKITMPMIGQMVLMGEMSRFCRSLSILVNAGLKLQEIMATLPHTTTNNIIIRDALTQVSHRLILGEGLAGPMSTIKFFPPLLVQMIKVGEESNTLGSSMGVVADFYETAYEDRAKSLSGFLGPAATILVALMVGGIAVSVIMPIYSLTGSFK